MIRLLKSGFVSAFALAVIMAQPCQGKNLEPYNYILALQKLQDQIVHGNSQAHQAQREMLELMARDFSKVKNSVWQKRKNAEALLIFMLSGGNPKKIFELLKIKNRPNLPEGLLEGALAFVTGDRRKARELLEPLVLDEFNYNVAAQLAMVKAALHQGEKNDKSIELLNLVKLLKPGTLLEEAALRRSVAIAGEKGKKQLFLKLSSAYSRRFNRSYYVDDFITRFTYYVVRFANGDHKQFLHQAGTIAKRFSRRNQAVIFLTIARAAILEGKLHLAEYAGQKAIGLVPDSPSFIARTRLYLGAANVVLEKLEEARHLLERIDSTRLDEQDRDILRTALMLLDNIENTNWPDVEDLEPGSKRKRQDNKLVYKTKAVARAEQLLVQANRLLEVNTEYAK